MRCGRLRSVVMEVTMSPEAWKQLSRVLDFIMAQPISPGATGVSGEPEKPKKKPKKAEVEKPQAEQLRMF